MKKFRVYILEQTSYHLTVEAPDKEGAEELALERFREDEGTDEFEPDYFVDSDEIKG